jgi:hypothetical protein
MLIACFWKIHQLISQSRDSFAYPCATNENGPCLGPESDAIHSWRSHCLRALSPTVFLPPSNDQECHHSKTGCWSAFDKWNAIEIETSLWSCSQADKLWRNEEFDGRLQLTGVHEIAIMYEIASPLKKYDTDQIAQKSQEEHERVQERVPNKT